MGDLSGFAEEFEWNLKQLKRRQAMTLEELRDTPWLPYPRDPIPDDPLTVPDTFLSKDPDNFAVMPRAIVVQRKR